MDPVFRREYVRVHLPRLEDLDRATSSCEFGHTHKWNPSFGDTNLRTVGLIYEICCAPKGSRHCLLHLTEMPVQMDDKYLQLLRQLVGVANAKSTGPRSARTLSSSSIPCTPTSSQRSASSQLSAMRFRSSSIPAIPVRRPSSRFQNWKPGKVQVIVYVFVENNKDPIIVEDAYGTPDGPLVKFHFKQDAIVNKLFERRPSATVLNALYTRWDSRLRNFTSVPRLTQEHCPFLGEVLIYKHIQCTLMPKYSEAMEAWEASLAAIGRADSLRGHEAPSTPCIPRATPSSPSTSSVAMTTPRRGSIFDDFEAARSDSDLEEGHAALMADIHTIRKRKCGVSNVSDGSERKHDKRAAMDGPQSKGTEIIDID
ncbi:hypothetical protein OBBRIDRAFT_839168 [Obba rivulosa]|uniref:Uncharacterized protein n=1 Tax=Obba rivulosa TaxID=1052685 RepID=A0A8E2DGT6_9APHY|nr:hypothetical protein OBBRIDRAFT_839168 [Obba rivulosa]